MYKAGRQDWPIEDRGQLAFHRSTHIIRALFPGTGFGKSTSAAVEVDYWLQGYHPYQFVMPPPVKVFWVSLKYAQMGELRQQLETFCFSKGWTWNENAHRYKWPNKSTLTIISNDADWAGAQGTPPDLVVIDEECDQKLWLELTMRRRGHSQTRYVISATATKGKRWMHREIYTPWLEYHSRLGLSEEQAMREQKHPNIWCWPKGGIEDNPGAQPGDEQWYADALAMASPGERQVRLHGGFQDFSVAPVFNLEALQAMEEEARELGDGINGWLTIETNPQKRAARIKDGGVTFDPGMTAEGNGRLSIYEMPTNDYYVVGADFAYGLENRDADAAVVLRQSTGEQVAVAEGRWGDVVFSRLLWALCLYYREALLVGERQVGLPSLRRIYDEFGYHRIYWTKDERHRAPRHSDMLGHHAMAGDMVIPRLAWAIAPKDQYSGKPAKPKVILRDLQTIEQFRQYEWRPRSRLVELGQARDTQMSHGAPPGEHDDLVRAAGYAYLGLVELPKFPPEVRTYGYQTMGDILKHDEAFSP
jgi:hypothetical protein